MYAVGRLGSYITRGVYTVSGSFHPFGGAVDIIVVEQPDGSFKSSPWYVRFGKFQGVLKAREKVVNITVNGIDANFHMYLDQRGEAYFLREVEGDEGESVSSSSSDETDEQSQKRMPLKSKSCKFDGNQSNSGGQIDGNIGKIVTRTSSQRSRILGLVFGRRSMKEDGYQDENNGDGVARMSSLERAEIAADLLDVKWSTNLASKKSRKDNALQFSDSCTSDGKGERERLTNNGQSQVDYSVQVATETSVSHYMLAEETGSCNVQMVSRSQSGFEDGEFSVEETSVKMSSLGTTERITETCVLNENSLEEKLVEISGIARSISDPGLQNADQDENSEVTCSDSQIVDVFGAFPSKKFHQEWVSDERNVAVADFGISKESGSDRIQSFICKKYEKSFVGLDSSKEQPAKIPDLTSGRSDDGEFSVEETSVGMSSLDAIEWITETCVLNENSLEVKLEEISGISRSISGPGLQNADQDENSEVTCSDSQIVDVFGAFPSKKFHQEWVSDERNVAVADFGISKESGSDRIQSFICKKYEKSLVGLDSSKEQSAKTPDLTSGGSGDGEFSVEETSVEMSSLGTTERITETCVLNENSLEGKLEEISGISRSISEPGLQNADQDENFEVTCSDSQIMDLFGAFPSKKFDQELVSDERNVAVADFGISKESGSDRIQSFICKKYEKSLVGLDSSKEQSEKTPDLNSGGSGDGEFSVEETSVEMSSLGTTGRITGTCLLNENSLEEKLAEISGISRSISEPSLQNADQDENSEISCSDSQIMDVFGAFPSKKFHQEWVSDERNVAVADFGISKESGSDRIQSFICKKYEKSLVGLDSSKEQSDKTPDLTSGGSGDVNFCAEALHMTADLLQKDAVTEQAEEIELEMVCTESCDNYPQLTNPSPPFVCCHDEVNLEVTLAEPKSYTQMVTMDPTPGLTEVESTNSSFTNSVFPFESVINIGDKITRDEPQPSLELVGGTEQLNGDCDLEKAVSVPAYESSEEEQFIFSDLDGFKHKEIQGNLKFSDDVVEENNPSFCPEGIDQVDGPLSVNDESFPSEDSFPQKNQFSDDETLMGNLKGASSPISIPSIHGSAGPIVGRLAESLPNMWSCSDDMGTEDLHHPLSHSLESDSKSLEWKLDSKYERCFINSDTDKENQSSSEPFNKEDSHHPEIEDAVANPVVGDPSKAIVTTGGSWRLWPFTFSRSRSRRITQPTVTDNRSSDAQNVLDSSIDTDSDKNVVKPNVSKKMVREITPTSEELASLNLKEGSNTVTFTFSTAMLGKQKVDARIYLWKWTTRIVISDVDGTITKSDVLGQFMPLVGMDWSQTGVAPLFSAIKENGYQLLFLSARAITQAYHTRQFLVNLKQNGKALPDGPVVISPDGLFPSLFREVIRRAPHEFKIACLEDIKALFPPDCNPFYAGFGNRDTDEISYLKVGIPKGKIFIINPKGEVAVNRRVDTKSYTTLHDLVHGIFPAMRSSEQEDYNSWNFWKLPPLVIDS